MSIFQLGNYEVLVRLGADKTEFVREPQYIWSFTVVVWSPQYVVDTICNYECSEEEYQQLKKAKEEFEDIKYVAELAEIYEYACWKAYYQEYRRFLEKEDYGWVNDFDKECEIELSL